MTRISKNRSSIPGSQTANRVTLSRWKAITLAFFICLVAIPFAHGVIPWGLSTLMFRYGWQGGSPGVYNWLGVIVVAAAAALLVWILAAGLAQAPKTVTLGLTASFLMTLGPYRYSRNPMYVAELGLWLGWSLFFGSLCVFAGFLVFLSVVTLIIVPREERGLEAAFGQAYLQYKDRVPRWLPI